MNGPEIQDNFSVWQETKSKNDYDTSKCVLQLEIKCISWSVFNFADYFWTCILPKALSMITKTEFLNSSIALLFCCLAVGCGGASDAPTLHKVTGTVTYNGEAVPGAKVMFLGDGTKPPAVGVTDTAGKYTLSSLAGTGAVAGKHAVAVVKMSEVEDPAKVNMTMEEAAAAVQEPEKNTTATSLIPTKYSDAQTSGLEFEVKSGANEFSIELKD